MAGTIVTATMMSRIMAMMSRIMAPIGPVTLAQAYTCPSVWESTDGFDN